MENKVKPIPEGYHTVSPILVVRGGSEAIEFYKQAFDAEVVDRMDRPDGKVMHASLKLGDSIIMLGEECEPHVGHEQNCPRSPAELHGTTFTLYLYVEAVDTLFEQAVKAGGQVIMPVQDMFWGDRAGMLRDPFGHCWFVATHTQDLNPEQIKLRMETCGKP